MRDDIIPHHLIREWPEIRGLQIIAWETAAQPRNVSVGLVGGPCGLDDIADIDGTEPGARAKAVSLGDMLQSFLESAEFGWFTLGDQLDASKRHG